MSSRANFKFCSCAGIRTEELESFLTRKGLAGTSLTPELMRKLHLEFLKETAPRCPGGTNKGRCVTGCEPTFKREVAERWPGVKPGVKEGEASRA